MINREGYGSSADLTAHSIPLSDMEPSVIATDYTGAQYDGSFPGFLASEPHPSQYDASPGWAQSPEAYAWRDGTNGLVIAPDVGGRPGRVGRLSYADKGPAFSGSVCDHELTGARIRPGRPSIIEGGPVGRKDLGGFLAVAFAQQDINFPAEDLAQLQMLMGL